jgi:methionyl-tRNA formyltransferase
VRIVFLGTAEFAVPSLRVCAERHEVSAVVTQPDRPGHRGEPAARPVRDAARALGLPVLQPGRIRAEAAVGEVLDRSPDCLVVAAYGQILPPPLLDTPRFGAVNVHASLLPRWRGAAPVARAILAGDGSTGVSIMRMDAGLDTGPLYATRAVPIAPDVTTPGLTAVLADVGATLLLEVLAAIAAGDAVAVAQDESGATYARRLTRDEAMIEWAASTAAEVDRHVRAMQPWPGTIAPLAGADVRLVSGTPVDGRPAAAPGTVIGTTGESALIAAREGAYRADMVHPPGARQMTAAAYLRGRR